MVSVSVQGSIASASTFHRFRITSQALATPLRILRRLNRKLPRLLLEEIEG